MLERPQRFVDESGQRLDIALRRIVDDAGLTIEKLHASLTALSPQSTLNRGYAVVQSATGHVVDNAQTVHSGDELTITLRHGTVLATASTTAPSTPNT
jgi:exodeoxyribonuclease VII large subunit